MKLKQKIFSFKKKIPRKNTKAFNNLDKITNTKT